LTAKRTRQKKMAGHRPAIRILRETQRLVCREAIQQSIATSALQRRLRAALGGSRLLPARRMRRIPRQHRWRVVQPLTIMMADHRDTGGAAGPVAAGAVIARRERPAVRLRAGEDVVTV